MIPVATARSAAKLAGSCAVAILLSGCMGFSPDGGVNLAAGIARSELGQDVRKLASADDAIGAQVQVNALLRKPLTASSAVQIALLKNRGIQASFNDLGVSEANFVKATLPPSPRLSLSRLAGPGVLEIDREIVASLLQFATLPERKAIAETRFRAAQYRAAEAVLSLAAETRRQFYRAIAANQAVAFLQQSLGTAEAASTLATQLGETGALNKLEQAREHAFNSEVVAQLAQARIQAKVERERLIRQLGLWGRDIDFKLPTSLPGLPTRIEGDRALEARALANRVDIEMARLEIAAMAREYGLTNATRFVSAFDIGAVDNFERSTQVTTAANGTPEVSRDVAKKRGVSIELEIPIYDFGESSVRGARESYLGAANRLAERAVNARSQVREAYLRYRGQLDLARHYQSSVLPLRQAIQEQSQLQYSGMLADVGTLIQDARARILSNIQAINARRDFWIAAVDLKAALVGGVAQGGAGETAQSAPAASAGGGAD